jgi:hypothetical protein
MSISEAGNNERRVLRILLLPSHVSILNRRQISPTPISRKNPRHPINSNMWQYQTARPGFSFPPARAGTSHCITERGHGWLVVLLHGFHVSSPGTLRYSGMITSKHHQIQSNQIQSNQTNTPRWQVTSMIPAIRGNKRHGQVSSSRVLMQAMSRRHRSCNPENRVMKRGLIIRV